MEIIVSNLREGIAYYKELDEWVRTFDMDPDDPMFDELALMEGDPDMIKWGGNEMSFFDIDLDGKKFILTSDEVDAQSRTMLKRFHGTDLNRWYESLPCDFAAFDNAENAIAHRGGSGYLYHIWKYTGGVEPS